MGNIISQSFPPKSLFTVEQIPDLTGQVMIVTGGNTGIGKETCKALLIKNAKVYLAARSKSRADAAIEWLKSETDGKAPVFLELDLANLASVRKAVEEFKSKEQELHVLFNNAGVMGTPVEQRTADGYDLQFGTNVLGHYFFTTLLLPTLIHTAKFSSLACGHTRVINTSSSAVYHAPKGGIIWETLGIGAPSLRACKTLGPNQLYYQSKLGNVLFSNEVAKRYAEQGIISSSLNPGAIFKQNSCATCHGCLLNSSVLLSILRAMELSLNCGPAPCPRVRTTTARQFLIPWARAGDAGPYSHDEKLAERLWAWLEEQVKEH
ncbi:unnamed protein product [Rhizoctonia solani]|uniref:NAD(P)-binding protein n=1 Tax=Rhizoctonia solani TaxID=456999 RepID=A0A8H3HGI6_9AGAM|nr:unnamed protein product [Rhizoctonia solani]